MKLKATDWLSRWVAAHPWALVFGALGLGVGVLIALPVFQTSLIDGAGDIIGASIGSFLAVGVAAWISTATQNKERAESAELLLETFAPLLESFNEALHAYYLVERGDFGPRVTQGKSDEISSKFKITLNKLGALKRRQKSLKPVYFSLGPIGHLAYADMTRALDSSIQQISQWIGYADTDMYNGGKRAILMDFFSSYTFLAQSAELVRERKRAKNTLSVIPTYFLSDSRFNFRNDG